MVSAFAQPGVPSQRAAGFFPGKKYAPGFVYYVNSGNCQTMFSIYDFCDLSKKTRAGKSWVWAVLRPPDLLRRADW